MNTTCKKAYLLFEFCLLFLAAPLAYSAAPQNHMAILILLLVTAICLGLLLADKTFDRKQLWNRAAVKGEARRIMLTFLVATAVMTGIILSIWPGLVLQLPKEHPAIWVAVLILYPVLSVYPQELLYRAFVFHRYKEVFLTERGRIVISALAFGYLHIVFHNPVAVALTIVGGVFFAWNYSRTRSLASASLEHALYGCYIFTIGYGFFFYTGTRALAAAMVERAAHF